MTKEKSVDTRARNFACVVYPESAPGKWMDILSAECVPAFISPIHDKDIDPQNQPKKAHYHVLLMFEGKKTNDQVLQIFAKIGGVGLEKVNSLRGYSRYLCHLDNPEKAQYSPEDVRSMGGADYHAAIGLPTDKYKAIKEIMAWCKEQNVYSYAVLLEYAAEERYDWFRVLCDNGTVVVKEYLKSRSWTDGIKVGSE